MIIDSLIHIFQYRFLLGAQLFVILSVNYCTAAPQQLIQEPSADFPSEQTADGVEQQQQTEEEQSPRGGRDFGDIASILAIAGHFLSSYTLSDIT